MRIKKPITRQERDDLREAQSWHHLYDGDELDVQPVTGEYDCYLAYVEGETIAYTSFDVEARGWSLHTGESVPTAAWVMGERSQ